MRPSPVIRIAFLFLIAVVSAACLGDDSADGLDGSWQMTSGTVDGEEIPILDDHPITLTFAGNEMNGTAACNGYSGTFDISGTSIDIGDLSMTEMGCFPQEIMEAEAMFADAITRVDQVSLDGRLTLTGDGIEMVFDTLEPVPDAELTNTVWVLDGLVNGDAVSTPVLDTRATLEFFTDGSALGDTGCRPFSAQYTISGSEVSITGLTSDGHECEPDLASQDEHVVSALESGFTVDIEQNRLTVSPDDGNGLVYLAELTVDPPPASGDAVCDPVSDIGDEGADRETLHLWVSNQSFEVDPASVEIHIDDQQVVCDDFFVEGQHNWILFNLTMEPGEHVLRAVRTDGTAELTETFDLGKERWAVVDFWFYPEDGSEEFTFSVHDEPVGFA
jgi:heat shock protein HslJ